MPDKNGYSEDIRISKIHINIFALTILFSTLYLSFKINDGNWNRFIMQSLIGAFVIFLFYFYLKKESVKPWLIAGSASYFYSFFILYPESAGGFALVCMIPIIPIMFFEIKMFKAITIANVIIQTVLFSIHEFGVINIPAYGVLDKDMASNAILFYGIQAMLSLVFSLNLKRVEALREHEIEKIKDSEHEIQYLEGHDRLTGLFNRKMFIRIMSEKINLFKDDPFAVLLVDLDNFKNVNDVKGHDTGDTLILSIAEKIVSVASDENTIVARMGGDEFALLYFEGDKQKILQFAENLKEEISKPFLVGEEDVIHQFGVTSSIGISIYPQDEENASELLKYADMAMYDLKRNGKNGVVFFSKELLNVTVKKLALKADLEKAIEKEELKLFYQPQVNMNTGETIGAEALIRWVHPERGMISPLDFIPLAEETGLIVPIGEWVLKEACHQFKKWDEEGYEPIKISVNLSAKQFDVELVHSIYKIIEEIEMDPKWLGLEITESIAMKDHKKTIQILSELRKMGTTLSIDDFGTGHSSLNYLKDFPVHVLKIDRSFIRNVDGDKRLEKVTKAIVSLAQSLDLGVIAEGAETEGQLAILRRFKCNIIQGFYYSPPIPPEKFETFLKRKNLA